MSAAPGGAVPFLYPPPLLPVVYLCAPSPGVCCTENTAHAKRRELIRGFFFPPNWKNSASSALPMSDVFMPVPTSLGHWERSFQARLLRVFSPFSFSLSQVMSCLLGIKLHTYSSRPGPSCCFFFSFFSPLFGSKSFWDLQVEIPTSFYCVCWKYWK